MPGLREAGFGAGLGGGGAEPGLFRTQRGASLRGRVRLRAPCARVRRAAGWTRTARTSELAGSGAAARRQQRRGGGGGGSGRSAPRLPGLASFAAPRPDLPPPPPGPDLGSAPRLGCQRHPPSRIRERSAGRRDTGASVRRPHQANPAGRTFARPCAAPQPSGSCPFSTAAETRVPAQPSGTPDPARAHQAQRSAAAPRGSTQVPQPKGPAISSGRRGEGSRRAGGQLHPPPRGISKQPGKKSRRGPATQGGEQPASVPTAPRARCGDHRRAERGFPAPPPLISRAGAGLLVRPPERSS